METRKMTLADRKRLMNDYPDRVVLPYFNFSTEIACWLLENPTEFHDELVARYHVGEIHYDDLASILENETNARTLYDISELGNIVNRKTGEYFAESIEPGAKVNIRPISRRDIRDKYFVSWISEINDNDEINGGFLFSNPIHNEQLVHNPISNNHGYGCWVDDKLEGVIRVDTGPKIKHIWSLFVNPVAQRSRLGSILLNYVVSIFGDSTLRLNVYIANKPAIQMYKKFGFVVTCINMDMDYYEMTRKTKR